MKKFAAVTCAIALAAALVPAQARERDRRQERAPAAEQQDEESRDARNREAREKREAREERQDRRHDEAREERPRQQHPAKPRGGAAEAARIAQRLNGGGRVLSVQPDGDAYQVRLLKDGEVRSFVVSVD